MAKKKKEKLLNEKLYCGRKPLHDGSITRGPYPVKSLEAREILKKIKTKAREIQNKQEG